MKIGVFGNFGWGNLGNSATLEAAVAGVHKHWPAADLLCICTNPDEVRRQYGYDAAPIRWDSGEGLDLPAGRVAYIASKLIRRPPSEVRLWQRASRLLHGLDLLLVAGTGILDDFAIGPMDLPFDLFKWSLQARRRHVPLAYLSTGAGPIDDRRSRILIKYALRQAIYRSYRDEYSRRYLGSIGYDITHDSVYPGPCLRYAERQIVSGTSADKSARARCGCRPRRHELQWLEYYPCGWRSNLSEVPA